MYHDKYHVIYCENNHDIYQHKYQDYFLDLIFPPSEFFIFMYVPVFSDIRCRL